MPRKGHVFVPLPREKEKNILCYSPIPLQRTYANRKILIICTGFSDAATVLSLVMWNGRLQEHFPTAVFFQ